ncbi:hypothetical protein OSTOST_19730, partial [Ostertagia ostertagi]
MLFQFCLAVRPFLLKRFPFVATFRVLFGCAPIFVEEVSLRCDVSSSVWLCAHFVEGFD